MERSQKFTPTLTQGQVLAPRQEVDHEIASHGAEPIAKATFGGIVVPAMDRLGYRDQYLLDDVMSIGVLKALGSSQAKDQGLIDRNELIPRIKVCRIGKTQQQAISCLSNGIGHSSSPNSLSMGRKPCLRYTHTHARERPITPFSTNSDNLGEKEQATG